MQEAAEGGHSEVLDLSSYSTQEVHKRYTRVTQTFFSLDLFDTCFHCTIMIIKSGGVSDHCLIYVICCLILVETWLKRYRLVNADCKPVAVIRIIITRISLMK